MITQITFSKISGGLQIPIETQTQPNSLWKDVNMGLPLIQVVTKNGYQVI